MSGHVAKNTFTKTELIPRIMYFFEFSMATEELSSIKKYLTISWKIM